MHAEHMSNNKHIWQYTKPELQLTVNFYLKLSIAKVFNDMLSHQEVTVSVSL